MNITNDNQVSNWEQMADNAFKNSSFNEAYNYYCKILEYDINNWFATYRKGLCVGWQANINNFYGNAVLGGVIDATKLLYSDNSQSNSLKANGSLLMATEVYNWLLALNNMAIGHYNQYASQLVSAAYEFYACEQLICELIKFNLGIINEFVYEHYKDKKGLITLANALCTLGKSTVKNMNLSFRIKTGVKWNSFWCQYEDTYEDIYPDYNTQNACNTLSSFISQFETNLSIWRSNYNIKIKKQQQQEKKERIAKYWEEHSDEKLTYTNRIREIDNEIKNIKDRIIPFDNKIEIIKKDLLQDTKSSSKLTELKKLENSLLHQKSELGMFAFNKKKQIQLQINLLISQITDTERAVELEKWDIKKIVNSRIAEIDKERKPLLEQIAALETEKNTINTELTKDR